MLKATFVLLFSWLLLNQLISAKKLEDIFTCANETECDELSEKDVSEEAPSTTENIYDTSNGNINSSIHSTQTPKIQVTTTQVPLKIKHNNETRREYIQRINSDVCECDLTLSSCNINCCCDKDCNDFQLTVFSHCENHQAELFDKRYCYNRNFIQRNNTPFILEKLANNLFCILYDNLPPTYSVNDKLDIKSIKELKEAGDNLHRLNWKWKDQLHVPEYNTSSPYQDDDILWIMYNNYIQPFELLQSGFTELCSFKKTLKYLREWKDQCLQIDLTDINKFLFPSAFNDFSVVISPHLLNEVYIQTEDQVCPRNVCLTLSSHYCIDSWKRCSNHTVLGSCLNGTCFNIVRGVKYLIVHNGSVGVNSIDVYFNIGNVSRSFYQQFEVSYEWAELNKEDSFSLSGNPGYIMGKPLIIGTLKTNKTKNVESKYISFNKTNSYLTLPIATKSGECNKIDRYTPAFGEDIKLKCFASIRTNNFSTASCMELQNLTMHLLMKDTLFNITQTEQYNIYISKSGNFSSNDTTDWAQILLDRIPQNITVGQIVNGHLHCSKLTTSIHLNILYSALTKPKTLTNYNVVGVGITFSSESNATWTKCSFENCTDQLKVDVISYVTFHDVSKPSKYYFIGGPNLDLTLPYDFFYPFLSCSTSIKTSTFLIIITLSIALHNLL